MHRGRRKNYPEVLEGAVCRVHTGSGMVLVPNSQSGNVVFHKTLGRILRSVLLHYKENINSRLNAGLHLTNKP